MIFVIILFISVFISYFLQLSTLSHSTRKSRSWWVFIVQIWFTYQDEAESIRKTCSAPFFFQHRSKLFFKSLLIGKKWIPVSYDNYLNAGPCYKKKKTAQKMKNPEPIVYSLFFQLCFDMQVISVAWKLTELYSF